jgi:hypothetical protein
MPSPELLSDRAEIADVVARLAVTQDGKDFDGFRALFADRVRVDLPGHVGDPPAEMGADELAALGRSVLSGFAATQHATSNVLTTVDGDAARTEVTVSAYHHVPADPGVGDWCLVRNRWELELRRSGGRWLIAGWAIVRTGPVAGNPAVYEIAAARAAG